ncbi:unnamed protein product [Symbiodinium microadriaticum]|nr:unnamed protein product [Symbiodinium microadriaticum]
MSNLTKAVAELSHVIQAELPHAVACLNIHVLPGLSQGGNKQVRLAMSGDPQLCAAWHQRRQLQGSKHLGQGAVAHFHSLRDTTSVEHQEKMTELVSLHSHSESGFLLDLPSDWVRGWPEGATSFPQHAGSLWYDFAAVWGPVKEASMIRAQDPAVVHLLFDFGSQGLFELLTDRYLYNPFAQNQTYPVRCALGHFQDLRLQLLPETADSSAAVPGTFELRRVHGEEMKTPQIIRVSPQRRVKLGRAEERLFIQDTSVNGTWVNERRIANGVKVELKLRDRISFLPSYTRAHACS